MTFEGALITEQRVTFGLIVVKPHVLHDTAAQQNMQRFGKQVWHDVPIVLMAQDNAGRPTYFGRTDIVQFMAKLDIRQIPMRRWTVAT